MFKWHGFTLIEILLALFIFTIVSLIMTKALHSIVATQAGTEKAAENLTQTQIALLLISRDLEQALDRPITDQSGESESAFVGNHTTFSFTQGGFITIQNTSSSLQRLRYRLEKNQLIRDTWPTLDQAPHTLPHHSRILLEDIKELTFRYLDKDNVFHTRWTADENKNTPANPIAFALAMARDTEMRLPRAVEINITFTNDHHLQQIYLLPQQEVPRELH